ncbi:mtfA protein [Clostridium sp. AF29-8BH]|jgi:hypothetical protein|uniref:mtfA protein n=1 Tax=Clostridium sp. AF29-8BH TaxID=2293009 RepID=UPI000E4E55D0|nr:mtfA protein [Clostridium sp. AF29-8BH]
MIYPDVQIGEFKTFTDWGLKLESMSVSFPEAKTDQVDIPGANGLLDLSEVNGQICYKNRTLTLNFSLLDDYTEWHDLSSKIARALHGKVVKCILPDDPNYYYEGRFSLQSTKNSDVLADFVFSGDVQPFKMERYTAAENWLWDLFSFENGIVRGYSEISVSGSLTLEVIGSDMPIVPEITCSAAMNVEIGGQVFELVEGVNKNYDIVLGSGRNMMKFTGNGTVSIDFRGGVL